MPQFVLDSNFFIQAHRVNYPIDVASGFWDKVSQLAQEGRVISIDKVKGELYDKNDALEEWCRSHLPDDFFKDTSGAMTEYARVTGWALSMSHQYLPMALNEFLSAEEADAYLVSYCLTDPTNRILVTQEISAPNKQNRVKIPDACNGVGVSFVNTIDMFRKLGERF
jgi:hypothetical protein